MWGSRVGMGIKGGQLWWGFRVGIGHDSNAPKSLTNFSKIFTFDSNSTS